MTTSRAGEQVRGRGVAQPVDVVVARAVLLDVEVGLRHVGLRLVVVVVGDEVLDRVVGKNSRNSLQSCAASVLLCAITSAGPADLLDDPGHRRRLAGAGRAEQRLVALAGVQARPRSSRSPPAGRRSACRAADVFSSGIGSSLSPRQPPACRPAAPRPRAARRHDGGRRARRRARSRASRPSRSRASASRDVSSEARRSALRPCPRRWRGGERASTTGQSSEVGSSTIDGTPSIVSSIRACSSVLKSGWFSNGSSGM